MTAEHIEKLSQSATELINRLSKDKSIYHARKNAVWYYDSAINEHYQIQVLVTRDKNLHLDSKKISIAKMGEQLINK